MDSNASAAGTGETHLNSLQEKYNRLRYLFHSLSISLLILTGVVFVYLYRQVVVLNQQTRQLAEEITEFQDSGVPEAIDQLRRELYTFSDQHPDFLPIFVRYFGTNQPPDDPGPVVAPADGAEAPAP